MTTTLSLVDPATLPFLSNRYAPVHDELTVDNLTFDGTIPTDITGAFLRNGPNPMFTPLGSYTYPLEGDGMLHGVWLDNGKARYANRYVRTQSLLAEERAGRALFGGVMTPAFVDQSLLGDDPDPGWPTKLDAFINIVRHGDRYLALEEGAPCYEIDPVTLETIGRYDFEGGLPRGITAHPHIDPVTGEMIVFRYDIEAPFLTWATIGADGTVTQPEVAVDGVDECYMIHDFAITTRYVVLVVGPLSLDIAAMFNGAPPLAWKPELGTRIAIIPRDRSGPARWVHTDAFWAWHYANAFDDGDLIHLDFAYTGAPKLIVPPTGGPAKPNVFTRATINPATGSVQMHHLDGNLVEFPRIDDRLTAHQHRFVVAAGRSSDPRVQPGEHDVLVQYDMNTGASTTFDARAAIGEAVFAPRTGGTDELDGYYLTYGTDLDADRSALMIFDAAHIASGPVCRIDIPRRIPNGLHGNWFPAGGAEVVPG